MNQKNQCIVDSDSDSDLKRMFDIKTLLIHSQRFEKRSHYGCGTNFIYTAVYLTKVDKSRKTCKNLTKWCFLFSSGKDNNNPE